MSVTYDGAALLCQITTRLLELHSTVSVARGMPHHELNQTAAIYSSQFKKKSRYNCGSTCICQESANRCR